MRLGGELVTKPPATRGPSPRRAEDDGFVRGSAPSAESPDAPSDRSADSADAADRSADAPRPAQGPSQWRARARATLRIIRANPTGRIAFRVFVGFAGALVVAIGLVLVPLPGPGWALVILGLAIWAIEFVWAKQLLRFTRTRVQRWTRWVKSRSWPVRIMLGVCGLVFIGALLLLSLKYSFGIDLIADVLKYVTTH
jgi:uncharacterized protein (TIGR02611 family)